MRFWFAVPLVLAPALILAACSEKAPAPQDSPSPEATDTVSGPTAAPGIALSDATVQLPVVPGRPGVAYFTLTPGSDIKGSLVAVHVDRFARAEMHESKMVGNAMTMEPVRTVPLTPGKRVSFAPGGYHVMLFDGDTALKAGDNVELTVTLDSGDKASVAAKVKSAGDDDMAGMKM